MMRFQGDGVFTSSMAARPFEQPDTSIPPWLTRRMIMLGV